MVNDSVMSKIWNIDLPIFLLFCFFNRILLSNMRNLIILKKIIIAEKEYPNV
jgi:hypothetical protein